MPPQEPIRPSQIKWNEVTWYSKLGAVILFLGVVPALCFYIGTQYGLVQQDTQFATQSQRTLKILDQVQQMQTYGSSPNIIDTNDFLGFLHNGFPIFPSCITNILGYNKLAPNHSSDINLDTCGINSYTDIASSTSFSLSDDGGWFDLSYQPSDPERPDISYMGQEDYKVEGTYHDLYVINYVWNGGGTAHAGALSVLKINGNILHRVKVIASGDTCSNPENVSVKGAVVSFTQSTPGGNICSGTTHYQYNLDTGQMSSSTTPSTTLKIHIDSMEPTSGPPGTIVTLHGTGFNDPQLNLDFNCLDFNIEPVTPACSYTMHAGGGSEPIMNMTTSTIVFKIDNSTPVGRYEVALYDITKANSDGSEIKSDNSFNFTVTK